MSTQPADIRRGNILFVDDSPENLTLLEDILTALGHTPWPASCGSQALEMAEKQPPDLILLDINMPEMDGYEICRRLKSNPTLNNIPVIFISGRSETLDIIKAFSFGGVDYITKPFFPQELNSRINTHLKLHFVQQELKNYANHLEELVIRRSLDLHKAHERLKILDTTKNEFLDVIAHELKTPATSVLAIGQLAIRGLPDPVERQELMAIFDKGSQRLQRTIDNALLLARLQTNDAFIRSENLGLGELLQSAIQNVGYIAAEGNNQIEWPGLCAYHVVGNSQLTEQCVTTVLSVALKMAEKNTSIILDCTADDKFVYLHFTAAGRTFAQETLETLFDTFSYGRISSRVEELGLSLPLSAQIAALFGGKTEVKNLDDPKGIQILLALKKVP